MDGFYAGSFPTLYGLDGTLYLFMSSGTDVDVMCILCLWRVTRIVWLGTVEYLTKMLYPSRGLLLFCTKDVTILVLDRGRLAAEFLGDVDRTHLAPYSSLLYFLC